MATNKRKISIRKVLQLVVTLMLTTGSVFAIYKASKALDKKTGKYVVINIKNEKSCHFIDKKEVFDLLFKSRHLDFERIAFEKLDLHRMEEIVHTNPWLSDVQVFYDNRRNLHVNISQRVPVFRVFETNGNSYYLDSALSFLPLSSKYTHYASVVTHVPELKDDSLSKDLKGQIWHIVKTIEKDQFWKADIQEIVVNSDRTFQLIPVVGTHRILIGDTSRLDEKLDNLILFYKKILNEIGWGRYDILDVRFRDQVVASPSLPWTPPKDKAMSDMSWVKSVLASGAKDEKGGDGAAQSDSNVVTLQSAKPIVSSPKPVTVEKPEHKPSSKEVNKKPNSTHLAHPMNRSKTVAARPQIEKKITKQKENKAENKKNNGNSTPKYLYPGNTEQ